MKNYTTKLHQLRKDHEFMIFIEEAMKIEAKTQRAKCVIESTKRDEYDDVQRRFPYYITYRDLMDLIGVSKGSVFTAKRKLAGMDGMDSKKEKVNSSGAEYIGKGNGSVYLYYFPTYKLYAELKDSNYYRCNIGKTHNNVEDRIDLQIGDQLPEKAILQLVMQTDDCETLEARIHTELKRRGRWLDPADVVGVEWFETNPAEVKDIFFRIEKEPV